MSRVLDKKEPPPVAQRGLKGTSATNLRKFRPFNEGLFGDSTDIVC
jgi:hypothetical protein